MQNIELFSQDYWQPFSFIGLSGSFWNLNKHTIINTWLVLGIIVLLVIAIRFALKKPKSIGFHLIIAGVESFRELYFQTLPVFNYNYFTFAATLFLFILLSNMSALLPFAEEPTGDLNTTLALAIIAFVYTQIAAITELGLKGFLKHFIEPIPFLLPLTIVEKLASVMSLSLRLFGNIFGGILLTKLYLSAVGGVLLFELIGIPIGLVIMSFFGIFESFIQAFVFTVLTLTYLSFAIQTEEDHA